MSDARLPERSLDRTAQALRKATRSYGALEVDPETPIEGWVWYRKDLAPPQLRVRLDGVTYKVDLTAV